MGTTGSRNSVPAIKYDTLALNHKRRRAEKLRALSMRTVDEYANLMAQGLEPEVARSDVVAIAERWRELLP